MIFVFVFVFFVAKSQKNTNQRSACVHDVSVRNMPSLQVVVLVGFGNKNRGTRKLVISAK